MFFDSFSDFLAMGGHGFYVWLAYGIAVAIIVYNVVSPLLRKKQFIEQHKRRLKREQRLAERQAAAESGEQS
ncbi:heme exporter protein CcmD [Motiliproteus sp.]|uniref:heme exporter protein CcmD n=1 Tax=Motiliproteus sp. TaxID=1898955 RepID=UPI003BAD76E0